MSWLQAPMLLTRLQLTGWVLAATLLAAAFSAWAGFSAGHDSAATAGNLKLAEMSLQSQIDSTLNAISYTKQVQKRTLIAFKLAEDLQAEREAHAATRFTLDKRIAHVTKQYRTALDAPPQPLPQCIFTTGFVSVFDASIGSPERHASDHPATGRDDSTNTSDPASELDSGITQADILQHIGAYGQRCLGLEAQLNTVLDAVEQQQGVKP